MTDARFTPIVLLDMPDDEAFLFEKSVPVPELGQNVVVTCLVIRKSPTESVLLRGTYRYVLKAKPFITEVAA